MILRANILTGAKHPASSTNHLVDIDKKQQPQATEQESSAVAEKPAWRDSIPNLSRRNPQILEVNIQCVYYGYIQLEIRYLVTEFSIQITSTYSK